MTDLTVTMRQELNRIGRSDCHDDHNREVAREWHLSLVRGFSRKQKTTEAAIRGLNYKRQSVEAAKKVHIGYARHYGAKWKDIAKVMGMDKREVKRIYG